MDSKFEQIINYLRDKSEPIPTLNIAKFVFGKDATTKEVNPTLYKMASQGLITKIANENGSKPRWSLKVTK